MNTYRYVNITDPKVMKGFVLASNIWVFDPKLIILLVEYEGTRATHRKIFCQIVTDSKMHIM